MKCLLDLPNSNLHVNVVHLHSVALLHQLGHRVNLNYILGSQLTLKQERLNSRGSLSSSLI